MRTLVPLQLLSVGCGAVLVAALAHASVAGRWSEDVPALLANPWGVATLVDVYIGFVFVGAWMVMRERRLGGAALWVCALLLLGNLVTVGYVLLAARSARGDLDRFLRGEGASHA